MHDSQASFLAPSLQPQALSRDSVTFIVKYSYPHLTLFKGWIRCDCPFRVCASATMGVVPRLYQQTVLTGTWAKHFHTIRRLLPIAERAEARGMRSADIVTYAVQPAGVPLIVAKVVTTQPVCFQERWEGLLNTATTN